MAKTSLADWDTTAASNTDIDGVNIDENCPAAGINNATRSMMAQIKAAFASVSTLLAASSQYLLVSPKTLFDACAWQALPDGATITPNQNAGLNFTVTLGGNRIFANMSNMKPGSSGVIEIVQDAAGNRALTWGSYYKFPASFGASPALTSTAGSIDMFTYVVRSSSVIRMIPVRDWPA